ncbi:MAG: site-specific DNA-methyltransferase, partial [Prevotella sp.]|nr:site-specific DNA-methyltransferase [Prevotella sp.]
IDDNEVDNLKKICNEVFGEQNFLECLIWKKRATPPNDRNIGRIHEFVLTYTKNIESVQLGLLPRDEASIARYSNPDNDPRGPWVASDLSANGKGGRIVQSCIYPITNPLNGEQYLPSEGRCWLFNQEKMTAWISEGRIAFRENTGAPYLKRYLSEVRQGLTLPTIMTEFGFSQTSAAEGDLLFKKKGVFEYAKPTTLLTPLTRVGASAKDALILDFFSGSSTTADAVMQLNAEDGGKRRFIMVQLPEPTVEESVAYKEGYKNVCEIGKERIRRAGEKAKEEAGLAGQNLDIGFRVYKLDSSNVKAWNPQEEDLVEAMSKYAEHLVGGRTEDDFLTEIMLKSGIDLVEEVQEREIAGHPVQSLGYGQYYACMAADLADDAEDVALGIAAWHEEDCAFAGGEQQDTCTVFVSDRAFASNDAAKMNFVAILEQHGICNIKAL